MSLLSFLLCLSLFSAALTPVIGWQYSYNVLTALEAAAGGLGLLAVAGLLWLGQRWSAAAPPPPAVRVGTLLGLLWLVEISINNFIAPPLPARDQIDNAFWAAIALGIFLLAGLSAYQAGSLRRGLAAGAWSGLVSGLLAGCMALSLVVFGMPFIARDPLNVAEWAARGAQTGAPSLAAYFAFETLAGAILHVSVLGVGMGALLGLLGGALGKGLRWGVDRYMAGDTLETRRRVGIGGEYGRRPGMAWLRRAARASRRGASLLACLLLTACLASPRPVVKIGLVAPFEGRYAEVGQEVIWAARLAVREANARGGVAGYSVELVSLDDSGQPAQAAEQARKLAADPQVLGALGHWLEGASQAAAAEYARAELPWLATAAGADLPPAGFRLWPSAGALHAAAPGVTYCPGPCDSLEDLDWLSAARSDYRVLAGPPLWTHLQFARLAGPLAEGVYVVAPAPLPADSADPDFAARYQAIAPAAQPRSYAVLAYDGVNVLLDALARDAQAHGRPTRAGLPAALAASDYAGLSGRISFDAAREWEGAAGQVYVWRAGQLTRP